MDYHRYIPDFQRQLLSIIKILVALLVSVSTYENNPCTGYGNSGIMSIPNQYIQDLRITPFIDNDDFIRLNVTLQSVKEFENLTGSIRVFSKDIGATCHRYRQQYFLLEEKQFLVPRYDYPDEEEEIKGLCEYIIDLDVSGNCILFSDSFTVPKTHGHNDERLSQCNPLVRITNVTRLDDRVIRTSWENENKTTDFIDIIYYIRPLSSISTSLNKLQELNNVTHYKSDNFSIICFEDLQNNTDYELVGKFIVSTNCYNISSFSFSFSDDDGRIGSYEVLYGNSNSTVHIIYFILFMITLTLIGALIHVRNKSSAIGRSVYRPPSIILPGSSNSTNILPKNEKASYVIISDTNSEDCNEFEVNPRNVTVGVRLGGGAFGDVYCANVLDLNGDENSSKDVAVKIPKDSSPYKSDSILEEINTMQKIGSHPNIVKLLGCCTKERPYMIIMELVEGGKSLKEYLKELRKRWEITKVTPKPQYEKMNCGLSGGTVWHIQKHQARTPPKEEVYCEMKNVLDSRELKNFALQIAKGMEHLEGLKIVHRDLAARNILMTEDKILKISDFGMSKTEAYFSYNPYKQPARWMAIESLKFKFFNTKTDVWSFGIVLWELGTLGALPYKEVEDNLLIFYLSQGARLGKPQICTSEMYSMMEKCWLENPDERPSFKELVKELYVQPAKEYVITNVEEITPPSLLFRGEGS